LVRLGDLPRAAWAYECARRGLPRDPELLANLQFVIRKLEIDDPPQGLLAEFAVWRARLSPSEQSIGCAVLMGIAAGCLVFGRRRLAWRWCGGLALVPALALALEVLWLQPGRAPVAIALRSLELAAEPKLGMPPIATVRPGVQLEVLGGSEGGFVRVRAADRSGFVARERIAVVE
jgi:hypothetical protein